nr:hypothetical protein [Tanacetum cinerariifolium]
MNVFSKRLIEAILLILCNVYYDVTPTDTYSVQTPSGGVTDWYSEPRYSPDYSSSDHFSSNDSSLDSLSDSSSGYSSDISSGHSILDSPFDTLAVTSKGLSRKRCRSSTTSVPIATPVYRPLSLVRANLLPPCKRIRGSISTTNFEVSFEESYEPYTEPDIDFGVQADIDVGIVAANAAVARKTDVRVEVGIETEAEAGYVKEELRQAREFCAHESQRLWRIETFMMRTQDYRL